MSHDQSGQDHPGGGRDEFDHFFTEKSAAGSGDPDATAWAGASSYDADRTHSVDHASYVRPPHQPEHDEYQPAAQQGYQSPAFYEEPRERRGAMWAPVGVIVASLAIVAVVIAIILHNSTGRMTQSAFTPPATVTKTAGPSQSSAGSQSSAPSTSASGSGSPTSSYATALPAGATSCPGTSSYGTGPKTSCAFAGVVSTLYGANKTGNGDASFQAKSPETHDDYAVTCHQTSVITCTTATGAVVYLLHQ